MSLTQDNATSLTITGYGSGTTGVLNYADDAGNAKHAASDKKDIVDQLKYIRDQWKEGKSVTFIFEVEGDVLKSITVGVSKPQTSGDE
jgi:hypothetical protein